MPARWTEKEIKQLEQMTANGASLSEISSELGRTPSAIKTKLKSITSKPEPKHKVTVSKTKASQKEEKNIEKVTAQPIGGAIQQETKNETSVIPYIIGIIVLAAIVITLMD